MNLETDKFNGYYTTGFINNGFFEKHLRFHSGDEYLLYHKIFNCNSELIITYFPVDIIPAIYIDRELVEKWQKTSPTIDKLLNLYFNIACQIVAIIGYWIYDCLEILNEVSETIRRENYLTAMCILP